ncbi:condensation domain-containing protein [Amycolatopsis saalfeldensis]|uniref:Phosphopantetheine attachment site n=1 Tax=Amycolatopsis saalfeldensis TaxID=394193 RepID=A0A1H8Y7X4_9PSEU|nr:condensation domain-containing protein [Amycolatopsis saalfeldensis]SEP48380.1 Phosphopantetheine attachment site [Amycolatopsis saalfeldensis]
MKADFQAMRQYAESVADTRPAPPTARAAALATTAQRGLWLTDSLSEGRNGYTVTHAYHLRGPLDEDALVAALQAAVDRHDALRTRFEIRSEHLWQIVADRADLDYARTDLRRSEVRRPPAEVAADRLPEPLDLAAGPVFRAELLVLADREHLLLLHIHHAVNDAASMSVLERDIATHYAGNTVEPAEPHQFWQLDSPGDPARAANFWDAELAGVRPPAPDRAPVKRAYHGDWTSADCSAEYTAAEKAGAKLGASPFAVLMTAMHFGVSALQESSDTLVGTTVSVRPPGFEAVVGPFVNTLPVRLRTEPEWTVADAVAATSAAIGRVLEYHEVPFEDVAPSVLRAATGPMVPLTLTSNTALGPGLALPGIACRRLELESPWCQRDLAVYLTRTTTGHALRACRSPEAYSAENVEHLLNRVRGFLQALAADPKESLTELARRAPGTTADSPDEAAAPLSLTTVREVCADLLDRPEAGLPDDFFDAGGGSLAAMRLAVRLGLSVRQIFQLRSMRALASVIDEKEGDA